MKEISNLNITSRLLAQQALRQGYELELYWGSPSTSSCLIRCTKNEKELYFKSLNTALTPAYGVFCAEDKVQTMSMLGRTKVPVPETVVIAHGERVDNHKKALKLLDKHGEVVVKPAATNHGIGITVGVGDTKRLIEAAEYARRMGGPGNVDVLVQQLVQGEEYRFLVLDGKVIAVATRRPPFVVGDGKSNIEKLIDLKNNDPRRSQGHKGKLTKISKDDVRFSNEKGFLQIVPADGEVITILRTSNLSKGGDSVDVTDIASSSLKLMAVHAAQACELRVAGVDIITDDIRDNREGSYVIEVNVSPGIRMHQFPTEGTPRNVAKQLFRAIEKTAVPIGKKIKTIGRVENVKLPTLVKGSLKARIDTGATMSSLWVSDIRVDEVGLHCKLFDKGHSMYTGKDISFPEYATRWVRSSMGHEELRYQVSVPIVIAGRKIKARVTLADRSAQIYPILIGRNVLRKKFIVDVASGEPDKLAEVKRRNMAIKRQNSK